MRTQCTIVLSISAGVAVGAAAVQVLHAQAEPPAYVVAEIDVANLEPFDKEYVPPAARAVTNGGGKYIVRGGEVAAFYGEPPKPRIAIMAFANMEKAKLRLILRRTKTPSGWETNTRNSAFMPWKACRNSVCSYRSRFPTPGGGPRLAVWGVVSTWISFSGRRAQASKLGHDSSPATEAICLLEWVREKESESSVYTPTT